MNEIVAVMLIFGVGVVLGIGIGLNVGLYQCKKIIKGYQEIIKNYQQYIDI